MVPQFPNTHKMKKSFMDPVPIGFQGEIREFLTRVYKLIIITI